MDDKTFFSYYIPALKKALSEDHINYGFLVKSPDWFYSEEISDIIDDYEDTIYKKYPILDIVYAYFDSLSHNFPDVGNMSIEECREYIVREMDKLSKKFDIN